MVKADRLAHCRPIFVEREILTVIHLYIFKLVIFIFKNMCTHLLRSFVNDFNTRNNGKIDVPQVRLEKSRSGHVIMGNETI